MRKLLGFLTTMVAGVIGLCWLAGIAVAGDTGHILVMNNVEYGSYKHSGDAIHWETPGNPVSASFAERGQSWVLGDNGSTKLPCPYGIHWISNENVLTLSHCLEDPSTTTTLVDTTSTSTSSSTSIPATTSTVPTTDAATTTTVLEGSTSTLSPTTTIGSSTTVPGSSTTSIVQTVLPPVPSTLPATTVAGPTTTLSGQSPTTTLVIPFTGNGEGSISILMTAAILLTIGLAMLIARRRPNIR